MARDSDAHRRAMQRVGKVDLQWNLALRTNGCAGMLQPVAGLFGMVSHHTNMLVSLATTWYCDKSFHDYAMEASAALT